MLTQKFNRKIIIDCDLSEFNARSTCSIKKAIKTPWQLCNYLQRQVVYYHQLSNAVNQAMAITKDERIEK
jgi:hypothetical protein